MIYRLGRFKYINGTIKKKVWFFWITIEKNVYPHMLGVRIVNEHDFKDKKNKPKTRTYAGK